jgi:hypothetical protein
LKINGIYIRNQNLTAVWERLLAAISSLSR